MEFYYVITLRKECYYVKRRLSVFTYKLTSYNSLCLWAILQEDIEKSMDCKLRRNPDTGAHGCESRIDPK